MEELPEDALAHAGERGFGFYVHVPFCTVRCGYCDFNTYTAEELGTGLVARRIEGDVRRGRDRGGATGPRGAGRPRACRSATVFFGGGTPTLLDPADLTSVVARRSTRSSAWSAGAEVTTEANPDSVTAASLARLREGGINRVSFGMQSAVDHVLRVLDRTHDPRRVPEVVAWARDAGFDQVSLDLIYGTPGESVADWERSLDAALACEPDHVSAYSLIVEEGTALARRVRRGEVPMPDEDDLADKYLLADERLEAAGLALVRALELGAGRGSPVPAQPPVLDGRRLVGCRPRRTLARRGRAVVERQAPGGVRRAAGRGSEPGPGPRGARRRDPSGRAGAPGAAAADRPADDPAGRGRAGGRAARWRPTGCSCGSVDRLHADPARPAAGRRRGPRPRALTLP